MKLIHSAFLAGFLATLSSAYATQVSFNGGPTTLKLFKADASTKLTNGDLYWIGTFATPGAISFNPLQTIAQNITAIESAGGWNQFTLDTSTSQPNAGISVSDTINGLNNLSGSFTDTTTGGTKADFFNGKALYVWIFDTTGTDPTQADQMGIFTGNGSASPAWTFPSNEATPPANSVALNVLSGDMQTVGGAGTVGTGLDLVPGATTPEPSTLASLIGAGGLVAMLRRRRASK